MQDATRIRLEGHADTLEDAADVLDALEALARAPLACDARALHDAIDGWRALKLDEAVSRASAFPDSKPVVEALQARVRAFHGRLGGLFPGDTLDASLTAWAAARGAPAVSAGGPASAAAHRWDVTVRRPMVVLAGVAIALALLWSGAQDRTVHKPAFGVGALAAVARRGSRKHRGLAMRSTVAALDGRAFVVDDARIQLDSITSVDVTNERVVVYYGEDDYVTFYADDAAQLASQLDAARPRAAA